MKPTINDAIKKLSEIAETNKQIVSGLEGVQKNNIEALLSKVDLSENKQIQGILNNADDNKKEVLSKQLSDENSLISSLNNKYNIKDKATSKASGFIKKGLNASESGSNILNTFNKTKQFISSAKSGILNARDFVSNSNQISKEKKELHAVEIQKENSEQQELVVEKLEDISNKLTASEKTNKKILEKDPKKDGLGLEGIAIASMLSKRFGKMGLIGGVLAGGGGMLEAGLLGNILGDGLGDGGLKEGEIRKKKKRLGGSNRGRFGRLLRSGTSALGKGFSALKGGKIATAVRSVGKQGLGLASRALPIVAGIGALPLTIITTGATATASLANNKGESSYISDAINNLTFGKDIKGNSKNTLGGWIYDVFNKKDDKAKLLQSSPNIIINQSKPKQQDNTTTTAATTTKNGTKKENLKLLLNDADFMTSLKKTAKDRGVKPADVLTMFNYESGGLKTDVTNELGYKGLFQLGKSSFNNKKLGSRLKKNGFSYDNFNKESASRQMDAYNIYLEYWQERKGKKNVTSLDDIMAIQLAPNRVNKKYLYKKGQKGYKANKPLDVNKDDIITKQEFSTKARDRFNEADYKAIENKVNPSVNALKQDKQKNIIMPMQIPAQQQAPKEINNTIDTTSKMGSVRNLSPYLNAIITKNLGETL